MGNAGGVAEVVEVRACPGVRSGLPPRLLDDGIRRGRDSHVPILGGGGGGSTPLFGGYAAVGGLSPVRATRRGRAKQGCFEGRGRVAFNAQADLKNVVASENASKSMLTEYFKANQKHPWARHILYKDFPGSFTWEKRKKFWKPRVERFQIGRIVSANPAEGERYYMRVLLNHVTGKTSSEDLLTVDGVVCGSFREAAERLGLIEADNTLDDCLNEAEQWAMPCSLRRLFATILVHCEPGDVRGLWDRHIEPMSDDYRRTRTSPNEVEQMVLLDSRGMLQSMGKDITATYDEILAADERGDGGVFFVDGPGGTGKTFLYRVMLAKVRSEGKIAIATATSGVAASIMPGGRTAHSRFKIPLSCDDGASCSFTKQSGTAKLLRMASLILWDDASMTKRQAVEALDNSMRDIMGIRDRPFGGKTVVFGGDFRQVLPVVRRGSRGQIIDATLRSSHLWKGMRQLRLITNMRAHNDTWFADYLLRSAMALKKQTIKATYYSPKTFVCRLQVMLMT
ncbi:uncharacterized protein [Aegilops tauschii subsp. strangulata]|uniref:uncharacterized protein n=1 Tax=Aegilops tauschii subsp. strangulata TaxID=200361 RepID=UPI00098B2C1E|nr:uncharacterized protein LOC109776010 [Aegilops tauschii subsp. strangulata]